MSHLQVVAQEANLCSTESYRLADQSDKEHRLQLVVVHIGYYFKVL